MSKRIQRIMKIAYRKTYDSDHKYPMAAVLVQKGKVVSAGVNRSKTHPKQKERSGCGGLIYGWNRIHAELDCLIRSPIDAMGGTMFVVRRNAKGVGMAKPCVNCEKLLREYGIKKVIFSILKDFGSYGVMEL